jgi:hypothetical protein
MRQISLVAAIAFCVAVAAQKVTPLNIKTGLWEVTATTTAGSDDTMLPSGLLEKLTPEQRARMEERMKARQTDVQKTTITKQCLSRRDLESGVPFRPTQESCIWTVINSTSSKIEMRGDCVDQGFKTGATLRIEALSPEEAQGSLESSRRGENAPTPATTSTFKAKWIGQCRTP